MVVWVRVESVGFVNDDLGLVAGTESGGVECIALWLNAGKLTVVGSRSGGDGSIGGIQAGPGDVTAGSGHEQGKDDSEEKTDGT